jgi:outer membrane lipoprotein SlyB
MGDALQPLMLKRLCIATVLATGAFAGCATTSTRSTTVSIPSDDVGMTGQVVAVRENVQRVEGNPAGGALAGGVIGGLLFRGIGGAAVGAATGAIVSSGSSERRTYEVHVRFDDGTAGHFDYVDYAPFRPGDRVVITPEGLGRG